MDQDISPRLQLTWYLCNCQEDVLTYQEIYEKEMEAIDIGGIILASFKEYIKVEGDNLTIVAPNYMVYCGSPTELTASKEINIYGEAGVYEFIELAKVNGWKVLDIGLEDLLDLDFPQHYSSYLEYRKMKLNL